MTLDAGYWSEDNAKTCAVQGKPGMGKPGGPGYGGGSGTPQAI